MAAIDSPKNEQMEGPVFFGGQECTYALPTTNMEPENQFKPPFLGFTLAFGGVFAIPNWRWSYQWCPWVEMFAFGRRGLFVWERIPLTILTVFFCGSACFCLSDEIFNRPASVTEMVSGQILTANDDSKMVASFLLRTRTTPRNLEKTSPEIYYLKLTASQSPWKNQPKRSKRWKKYSNYQLSGAFALRFREGPNPIYVLTGWQLVAPKTPLEGSESKPSILQSV